MLHASSHYTTGTKEGWWKRAHTHIHTPHFCSPLASDTGILQSDIGDGLDALSRQRGSMFSPAAPRNLENGDTHTYTLTEPAPISPEEIQ